MYSWRLSPEVLRRGRGVGVEGGKQGWSKIESTQEGVRTRLAHLPQISHLNSRRYQPEEMRAGQRCMYVVTWWERLLGGLSRRQHASVGVSSFPSLRTGVFDGQHIDRATDYDGASIETKLIWCEFRNRRRRLGENERKGGEGGRRDEWGPDPST